MDWEESLLTLELWVNKNIGSQNSFKLQQKKPLQHVTVYIAHFLLNEQHNHIGQVGQDLYSSESTGRLALIQTLFCN